MGALTFLADVAGGQLRHGESLAAFEGRQVRVTVALSPSPSPVSNEPAKEDEDGPPAGMDVENDILLEMPPTLEILKDTVVVEKGIMPATIILPEELPDE